MTTRTITVVTSNLGRGVSLDEFKENVDRIEAKVPGQHRFFGFQEVDEADLPAEMAYLRHKFRKTHRFVGSKTAVPIAIPRTFTVARRQITFASSGVAEFSPHRQLVQAVVYPNGHPDAKSVAANIHLGRNVAELFEARRDATAVVKKRLEHWQSKNLAAWLTADLNAVKFKKLNDNEQRLVTARLDYIRAYPAGGVKFEVKDKGTVDLTIDGHDCQWVKVKLTWP